MSSFYRPPLKRAYRRRHPGGRADAARDAVDGPPARSPPGGLHAPLRAPDGALEALAACGREVRVYGLGAQPSASGNLRFLAVDERRFMEDLATCTAVVSTAGNQLVGEALYLGKPVLVMPERAELRAGGQRPLPRAERRRLGGARAADGRAAARVPGAGRDAARPHQHRRGCAATRGGGGDQPPRGRPAPDLAREAAPGESRQGRAVSGRVEWA